MSFTVKLKNYKGERVAFDKNSDDLLVVQGVLKDGTSIIDPVIMVEANLTDLTTCNYARIESFGRWYFVQDIKSVRQGLVEISMHVDVLHSFKDEILANHAIIRKQENNWNLYLDDGTFKVYQNPQVVTKEFPSGFTTQEFVLAVAGA